MEKGLFALLMVGGFCLWLATNTHDDARFQAVMKAEGISQPVATGYSWFACSEDDWKGTGFTGIKNGQRVNGVLCGGLFVKADTVRYR